MREDSGSVFSTWHVKKQVDSDIPGGLGVKNLPANSGDTSSFPGLGRFLHAPGQLSPYATIIEAHSPWRPHSATREVTAIRSPQTATGESLLVATKTQHSNK